MSRIFQGQSARLHATVDVDTMRVSFEIQDLHGVWAAPAAYLLVQGQPATPPPDAGYCIE